MNIQHIQSDPPCFTAAPGPMSNGAAWAAYLATMADIKACTGADSILNAFNGLCRSDFDGIKIQRESDADLLRPLNVDELHQLHKLLEAQAGYVKPAVKNPVAYTAQAFRLSVFERVAPLMRAMDTEGLMRNALQEHEHASETEVQTVPRRRLRV